MRRNPVLIGLAAMSVVGLAACSSSSKPAAGTSPTTQQSPPVVIGSANFPENEILADIYAGALKKAGISVTTKLNIGSREVYFKEMENGGLNVFPEYNGALLGYLDPKASASSTADVNKALTAALPSTLEALTSAPAEDSDSVTVTSDFAKAHNLKSISDLKPIETQVTIGAAAEFAKRQEGLLGLKSVYGLSFKGFDPLDEAGPVTIAALNSGKVQAADIYTTDPSVAKYHFVALADPRHLFPAQNVTPIINKNVATSTVVNTLDSVSAALTTDALIQLVNAVVNDHVDAATAASQFLSSVKLG